MSCFRHDSKLASGAAQLQSLISARQPPSFVFAVAASAAFALQLAGLSLAVQRVGCDFGQNAVPDDSSCRGEAFLAALAVPGVSGYEAWDDVVFVLSAVLVCCIALASFGWQLA